MAVPRWGGGRMSCKRRSTKRSFLAPTGSKKQSFTPNGNRVKTANFTLPGPIYGRCHINRQSLEFNLAAQEQSAHPPCDRPLKKLGVEPFHPLVHHLCAAALLRQPRQSTTVRRQPNFFHHLWIIFLALAESPKKRGGTVPPPLFNITPTPSILRTSRWRATWRRCFQDQCEQFDSLHRKPTSPSALPCFRNAPLASALRGVEPFHPPL